MRSQAKGAAQNKEVEVKRMRINRVTVMLAAAFLVVVVAHTGWAAYIDNGNGTVTDSATGLTWQQGDAQNDGSGRTWEQAIVYCEELSLADRTDWRLPSVRELVSIVADSRHSPAIDPAFSCRSSHYWSSSNLTVNPDQAWYVHFNLGGVSWYAKSNPFSVRCVRAGPSE